MKPFSIKEHLEHPDWEVVTREGRPVRILCTDLDDNDYPVAAVVENFHVDKYRADGLFQFGQNTKYDLFFANEKGERWGIISKLPLTDSFELFPEIFATKKEAERVLEDNPGIKCSIVKIEWEDEQ